MAANKLLVLTFAAIAGFAVYKARTIFFEPNADSGGDSSFYDNVSGPGSLMHTYKAASAARTSGRAKADAAKQTALDDEELIDDMPLIQAAARGDGNAVEARLRNGARVDSRDALRRTALMYASWNGNEEVCLRLLAAGANPEFKDRGGNNAFDFAASRGLSSLVTYLLNYTKTPDDKHYLERAQLMQAVYAGDSARLPPGEEKLASVNRLTPEGQSPLHIAAGNGSVELMKALIARGAEVDILNASRQTPLLWAAWNNRTEAVHLLLQNGAGINKADSSGNTALMMAAQNGSLEAAKYLLGAGADKYVSNKQGKNAVIIAEDTNHKSLVPWLK